MPLQFITTPFYSFQLITTLSDPFPSHSLTPRVVVHGCRRSGGEERVHRDLVRVWLVFGADLVWISSLGFGGFTCLEGVGSRYYPLPLYYIAPNRGFFNPLEVTFFGPGPACLRLPSDFEGLGRLHFFFFSAILLC